MCFLFLRLHSVVIRIPLATPETPRFVETLTHTPRCGANRFEPKRVQLQTDCERAHNNEIKYSGHRFRRSASRFGKRSICEQGNDVRFCEPKRSWPNHNVDECVHWIVNQLENCRPSESEPVIFHTRKRIFIAKIVEPVMQSVIPAVIAFDVHEHDAVQSGAAIDDRHDAIGQCSLDSPVRLIVID